MEPTTKPNPYNWRGEKTARFDVGLTLVQRHVGGVWGTPRVAIERHIEMSVANARKFAASIVAACDEAEKFDERTRNA